MLLGTIRLKSIESILVVPAISREELLIGHSRAAGPNGLSPPFSGFLRVEALLGVQYTSLVRIPLYEKRLHAAIAVAALTIFAVVLCAANRGDRWRQYVANLAAEGGGQQSGPTAQRRTADYIAAQLQAAGVLPAAANGYMQPVKLRTRRIIEQYSRLDLARDGAIRPIVLGQDAIVGMDVDPAPWASAPLVFIGYGLTVPELGYDDLAGLDLHGKIAVILSGGPPNIPVDLRAHYQSPQKRDEFLRRKAGVFGIVTIPNPKDTGISWQRTASSRLRSSMSLADPAFDQDDELELSIVFNPERANLLFEHSGHTLDEILAKAAAGRPIPHFPLPASLLAKIAVERGEIESQNVIGVLPGSDPVLKAESVALTARLDDSGTETGSAAAASLLDTAEGLHESMIKLRRSLLFVFFTSEDASLLGSRFFTRYPSTAVGSIVADLNLSTFHPLFSPATVAISGSSDSDLGAAVLPVAARNGVRVSNTTGPRRIPLTEGSHYTFIRHGIPSIGLALGLADGNQPLDKMTAFRIDGMLLQFAATIANRTARPRWSATSPFKRFQ